jgi:hypothetical protein
VCRAESFAGIEHCRCRRQAFLCALDCPLERRIDAAIDPVTWRRRAGAYTDIDGRMPPGGGVTGHVDTGEPLRHPREDATGAPHSTEVSERD